MAQGILSVILQDTGFFFAGRLWNKPALEEMSMFSGTKIQTCIRR